VAKLTDYLDERTVEQLRESFSRAAGVEVRICDGEEDPAEADVCQVPVTVDGVPVASLRAERAARPRAGWTQDMLGLMSNVMTQLCRREGQLRTRVDELGTLYRLTAEFTARRDLQGVLDLVARTVVDVLRAKACSIRLLSDDGTELLVKAGYGFSPEYLDKGPILLSHSQIDRAVLDTGKCLYIADERTDPRVLYPAEARREGIVSALCAPLIYKGHGEGVVHVYTGWPHEFDAFEVSLLEAICAQAAAAIVNARLYGEVTRTANIRRHLNLAGEVQRRMIPGELPEVPGLDLAVVYVPCFELGGDFYDFIDLPQDNLGVAVCDVVGKGVRASLLMAFLRASLRAHAESLYAISDVLSRANRDLCAGSSSRDFATLFYGVIDSRSRRLTYASAGHVPALLVRDGLISRLESTGGVLGIDTAAQWDYRGVDLQSRDVLFVYTDGLPEATNFDDERFGSGRVEDAVRTVVAGGETAEGIVQGVLWQMRRFAGLQTRFDDLTMAAVKIL